MSTYTYAIIKYSWGIRIGLTAEALPLPEDHERSAEVAEGVWLEVTARGLTDEEHAMLARGLASVARDVIQKHTGGAPVLVRVTDVRFDPADYQVDGLAAAIAGWAARELGFDPPQIDVTFDRARNRYVFEWPT